MVESTLDRRDELMLKYKEKMIDGKGIAEKIRGELKQRIIARQLSKLAITMGGRSLLKHGTEVYLFLGS
jgi:hypothetical protein